MRVERLRLLAGETHEIVGENAAIENGAEFFVHPLIGRGAVGDIEFGGRTNVFHRFPGGLLLSVPFTIRAITDLDVVWAVSGGSRPKTEKVHAKIHMIGQGSLMREVREILGFGGPSKNLRCGETINSPGGWSSWPPHKFDRDGATGFEEVFYVFTDPRDGYGIMRKNGKLIEVRSGDRIDVPLGEHPIVAGPGVRLMYVWFYVGADKHYAQWAEDLGGYK